jgi:hypothetical protein
LILEIQEKYDGLIIVGFVGIVGIPPSYFGEERCG